jgi:hypothetical protein
MNNIDKIIKKKSLIFLIFIITILIPCYSFIFFNMRINETPQIIDSEPIGEIIKGTKMYQEIEIRGNLKKYGIKFGTYIRKNSGKIKIYLKQNNTIKSEEIVDMSTIKNEEFKILRLNFSKLKKGKAILGIEGIDGKNGSSVTLYGTSDVSLGTLYKDGKVLNKGLIQYTEFYNFDEIIGIQIIFLCLAMFSFFLLYKFSKEENKNNLKIYFSVVAVIFFVINVKVPTFSFYSEPFAETATNFFDNGFKINILRSIFIQDAGYWPLFQRVVSLVVIKLFGFLGPVITIFLMQNFAIIIISLIVSCFSLNIYRKYGDLWFRFVISILLGTLKIGTYIDTHAFINFSYYGIVGLILIVLLDFDKLTKKTYFILIGLTVFLTISKSHFIVLLPIVFLILIVLWKRLSKRYKLFLSVVGICNLLQLIFMIGHFKIWNGNVDNRSLTLFEKLNIAIHQVIEQFIFIFYPNLSSNSVNLNITFAVLFFFLIIVSINLLYKNRNRENFLVIIMILLIFGVSIFNVLSRTWIYDAFWMDTVGAYSNRHSFFIIIFLIFIFILLLYNFRKSSSFEMKKYNEITFLILGLFLFIRFSVFDMSYVIGYKESFSDWRIYSKFLKEKSYMIPIEPYPWTMSKNVRLYHIGNNFYNIPSINFPGFGENQPIDISLKQFHEIVLTSPRAISYLYVKRLRPNNSTKLKVRLYNKSGKIISELIQLNKERKLFVGFKNDKLEETYKIGFFNQDGTVAYVQPEILIASPLE